MKLRYWGLFAVVLSLLTLAGCSYGGLAQAGVKETRAPTATASASATPSLAQSLKPTNDVLQSTDAGSVTINVKWAGVVNGQLLFDVSMDTHSVELDSYDLGKTSVVTDDTGEEYRPVSWNAPPGGHHRSGRLAFPVPDSLALAQAKFIELTVKGTEGGDRVFKWNLA